MGYLIVYDKEREILGDKEEAVNEIRKETGRSYRNNGRRISQYEAEVIDKYGE